MPSIPEPAKFFLEVAPYTKFDIGPKGFIDVMRVQFFRGTLDAHCAVCEKESVFQSMATPLSLSPTKGSTLTFSVDELLEKTYQQAVWPSESLPRGQVGGPFTLSEMEPIALRNRVFHVRFDCPREEKQSLYFFFRVHNGSMEKVGQSPSLADLHLGDVKKYRKLLGDGKYQEFTKAVGLNAHGIGIGAFVYLRRIFENLIGSARQEAARSGTWDEDAYNRDRMDEKILLLRDSLPSFLVENRGIYSVLSRGIHELSEQECLNLFEPLKTGIELILDEKLEQKEKAAKIDRTKQALSKIKGDLKGGLR
jgi:hypothetical protein